MRPNRRQHGRSRSLPRRAGARPHTLATYRRTLDLFAQFAPTPPRDLGAADRAALTRYVQWLLDARGLAPARFPLPQGARLPRRRALARALLSRKSAWAVVDAARRGLALARITPHDYRHHLATRLLNAGVPLDVVQLRLGHRSVETTRAYYAHTDEARVIATVRRGG